MSTATRSAGAPDPAQGHAADTAPPSGATSSGPARPAPPALDRDAAERVLRRAIELGEQADAPHDTVDISSLLAAAEPLHGGEPLAHALADELLSESVVRGGTDLAGMSPAEPDVRASFDRVETRLGIRLAEYARATATSERNRRQRLRATIERDADQQLERVRAAIEAIEAFGGDAQASKSRQILPIYRAREQRIEETRRRRLEELEQGREPELSGATFAAGVVTVLAGTTGDECQESRT